MIDPKLRAAFEQSTALIQETIPPLVYGMYKEFIVQGFSDSQAFALAKAYMITLFDTGELGVEDDD